jgi:hypothetical protein
MKYATILLVTILSLSGCSRTQNAARSFDQELQLTLRAGRGELTDEEKSLLLQENHPILAQVGEPQMVRLMALFAELEPQFHQELIKNSYVKWKLADLPPETQSIIGEVVHFTVMQRGMVPALLGEDTKRTISLVDADVGFAVVELPRTSQRVVSWFACASQLPSPLWITIVNSPASKSDEYVQAHLQRLPLLRTMRRSARPIFKIDRLTYLATSPPPAMLCSVSG